MNILNEFLKDPQAFLVISGPCAVESEDQLKSVLDSPDAPSALRGGLYKMRTSPDSFQGLREEGAKLIAKLRQEHSFSFVTEISDPRQIETLDPITDMYQIGARNMYNYELLRELSVLGKPVLLKRAFSATIKEWLGSAQYLKDLGEEKIVLCERGIRSFEPELRNTLDLGSVIYLKENTNFKVLVDPSHAMGEAKYVERASLAAMAAGADGVIIESHPNPSLALSDAKQALSLGELSKLKHQLVKLADCLNKTLIH